VLFVDVLLIHPIAWESQHLRPVVLHNPPSLVAIEPPAHPALTSYPGVVSPAQADGGDQRRFLAIQRVKKVA